MSVPSSSQLLRPRLPGDGARIQGSPIVELVDRVRELQRGGVPVINMVMGESDLGAPAHVRTAVQLAAAKDDIGYTAPPGALDLREAVSAWFAREYDQRFGNDEVMASSGSKLILYELFLTLLTPGDEVLLPAPVWASIPSLIEYAGARPVLIPSRSADGFRPQLAAVEAALTPRTRALYLANPGNPTGAVLPEETLRPLARLCAERGLTLISDGAYRAHCYEGAVPNFPKMAQEAGAAFVIIETLSKRYSMAGWRIGFAAAHRDLIAAMSALQGQTLTCPPRITQVAAIAALSGPQDCVAAAVDEFKRRREVLLQGLSDVPGFALPTPPQGAFFALPDVTALLGKRTPDGALVDTDAALARHFLDYAHVAMTPGAPFGAPGHLRLAYTLPADRIVEACARLQRGARVLLSA
jgi:aspartate aminotransferase